MNLIFAVSMSMLGDLTVHMGQKSHGTRKSRVPAR